jgi:hypothetical protein
MSSSSYGPTYPSTAYILSLIGGILTILDGILTIVLGLLFSAFIGTDIPGASAAVAVVIGLGLLGVIFGFLIVFWAFRLKSNPASAKTMGILIIVFSLIGLLGGGGFYIGSILALIGGILALAWHPPMVSQPAYGQPGYATPFGQPGATPQWAPPASPPLQPGVSQRFCSSCGSPNVAFAQFCAKCGAPMS